MTETGFRDLFAELPRALFESLQAIGEAAVERASASTLTTAIPPPFEWLEKLGRLMCEFYGWREFRRVEVNQLEQERVLVVRLDCRHIQRYRLDEFSLLRAPAMSAGLVDLVCSTIESTPRACQCVQRPQEWSR